MKAKDVMFAAIATIIGTIGFLGVIGQPIEGGICDTLHGFIIEKIISFAICFVAYLFGSQVSEEGRKAIENMFNH